jgi:hypothetical protein
MVGVVTYVDRQGIHRLVPRTKDIFVKAINVKVHTYVAAFRLMGKFEHSMGKRLIDRIGYLKHGIPG